MTGILPSDYGIEVEQIIADEEIPVSEQADFRHHAMKYFETLPRTLNEYGYTSFQGGKWWEFDYENGGFDEGMSTGWTEEDKKEDGWFLKFMGGEGLELARATMEPVYEFIANNNGANGFIDATLVYKVKDLSAAGVYRINF